MFVKGTLVYLCTKGYQTKWFYRNNTKENNNNMDFFFPGLIEVTLFVIITNKTILQHEHKVICQADVPAGLILDLRPAIERRRYFVMASLIAWTQA